MHKSFKNEKNSIKKRFIERKKLLKPFLKLYKNPVLVHAVNEKNIFKKILTEGKIKLPKEHHFPKKTPFMERLLKIDNGIYYSLGFVYLTAYDWRYNFIFDINYLRELVYFESSINYKCYKAIVNYWYKYDPAYLEKLANTNKQCREVVDKYYNVKYHGKKRKLFDFWKIEKHVFEFINKYPNKKELDNLIRKIEKKTAKRFPYSLRDARKSYLTEKIAEIVGLKNNDLLNNKYFLGFYIADEIPQNIMKILVEKYPNKIIFDGVRIRKVSDFYKSNQLKL